MANQYTKLFIDNQELDLFDAEKLPLNIKKRVNSIDGSIQGDYSRSSVTVPATKNNISILGHSRMFFDFRIEVDGSPDFNGTAQVRKGKTFLQGYGAIECNYEINLISNNSSWFVLLGETLLSELTTENVNFDTINVIAGFLSEPLTRNWCFPLIKWKEWETFKGGTHYTPSVFESTPALFVRPLIVEAFNSIGYTIQSDFFDTDLFSKLILPTPIPDKLPKAYNDEYLTTKVSLSAPLLIGPTGTTPFLYDVIDQAAPSNPTAYNPATGTYTCPLDGYYEVKITWKFANPAVPPLPPPPYLFFSEIQKNAVALTPTVFTGFGGTAPIPYPAGNTIGVTAVIFCNAGDTIRNNFAWAPGNLTIDEATMEITGEAVFQPFMDIDFKYFLQDWKFTDMLQDISLLFNLTFETDDVSKVVTIEPKDNYLNTVRLTTTSEIKEGFYQATTKDYSKKIDYNKEGSFEFPTIEGRTDFLYNSDSEETIEWIEDINPFKIYESRFQLEDSDNKISKQRTTDFFVKSIHVQDAETRYPATQAIPQFPLIYPQNYVLDPTATQADKDASPRIFYYGGQRFGLEDSDGYIEIKEIPGLQTRVPMCFMVNYNDDSGLDPNLGFNNQTINDVESVGLMQRFYLQELARNNKGELRKNYVKFNSIDNLNFTFRIKAIIDGQRYIVQELEGYNPLIDAPTQFKFYLDVFPDSDDINRIQNSPLLAVVNFDSTP